MRAEEEELWERTLKVEEAEPLEEQDWRMREEGAELVRRASWRPAEEVLLNQAMAGEHAEGPPGQSLLLWRQSTVSVPALEGPFG